MNYVCERVKPVNTLRTYYERRPLCFSLRFSFLWPECSPYVKLEVYPTARKMTKNIKERVARKARIIIKIKKKEILITLFTLESQIKLRKTKTRKATSAISKMWRRLSLFLWQKQRKVVRENMKWNPGLWMIIVVCKQLHLSKVVRK